MEFFSKFADIFSPSPSSAPVEQKQAAAPKSAPGPMKQDLDGVIKALMSSKPKENDDKKILLDSKIKEIKLQCLMNKLRNGK
jgi:hypothetical protein